MPGFLPYGGEEFDLGSVMRLDCSELLCFIQVQKREKTSDIDIRRGQKECPLASF